VSPATHGALAVLAVLAAALAAALAAGAAVPGRSSAPARADGPGAVAGAASAGTTHPGSARDLPVLRLVAALGVAVGVWVLAGGVSGALAAPVAAAACWWVTGRMEPAAVRRRRERLAAAVPHVVDLMAACLGAGLSPSAALEHVADAVGPPARDELVAVSARLRLGVDPGTVWRDLARHPQLGGLGRALARAVESGASVADAMQRLSDDLRRAARADVESRARAVGVKAAVPLGVCLLPGFVLVGVVPLVAGAVGVLAGR
jgi:pilus assembly protein TadC